MAYLDHVRCCNAHDLRRFRPWRIDGRVVGFLRLDFIERLRAFPSVFRIGADGIALAPHLTTFAARTAALAAVCERLAADGVLQPARGEPFPVAPRWGMPALATLDRRWVTHFGLPAYGVHLNGYVPGPDGLRMWIARRSSHKMTYPGQLDNIVAGGQPAGLGLLANMLKEAEEEAAIPAAIAGQIRPAGAISYVMETEDGLKLDTMYCFDLALPADFAPTNNDGEVEAFMLLPVAEVATIVRDSFAFKFNCNLVIIDFLIRHGFLTPDGEPDYAALCAGMQAAFPLD
jgi:8-oxo-dGTP pyrophosphatase MutT (NUDIX family)